MSQGWKTAFGFVLALGISATGAVAQEIDIAGMHPDRRPQNAPRITVFEKPENWESQARHGISEPYPPHLGLEDQGAWFTPFIHPGMTGPYDIRQWHQVR